MSPTSSEDKVFIRGRQAQQGCFFFFFKFTPEQRSHSFSLLWGGGGASENHLLLLRKPSQRNFLSSTQKGTHSVHLLRGHSVWGVLVKFPRVSPGTIFLNPAELPLVTATIIMVKEKARKLPQESESEDAVSLP